MNDVNEKRSHMTVHMRNDQWKDDQYKSLPESRTKSRERQKFQKPSEPLELPLSDEKTVQENNMMHLGTTVLRLTR